MYFNTYTHIYIYIYIYISCIENSTCFLLSPSDFVEFASFLGQSSVNPQVFLFQIASSHGVALARNQFGLHSFGQPKLLAGPGQRQ